MKLQDFIKNTLVSISMGIYDANKEIADAKIGVTGFDISSYGGKPENKFVTFDVAVTTSTEVRGKATGSGDIIVANLGLEGGGKRGTEHISRVTFKVFCK